MFRKFAKFFGAPDRVRFLLVVLLPLFLYSCSAPGKAVAPSVDRRPPLEQAVGPGEVAAMFTGSWQSRSDDRSGMAILGGSIAYDMVTTEREEGRPVARKRLSAGPLFIAGSSERRALARGVEESRSHWFFPFYRYVVKDGKKTLYPLFFIPIPMGSEENTFAQFDSPEPTVAEDSPWANEILEDTVSPPEVVRSPQEDAASIPEGVWSQGSPEVLNTAGTYKVVKGDTLYSLARRFYSDQGRWRSIHQANMSTIPNPNRLPVGVELVLP